MTISRIIHVTPNGSILFIVWLSSIPLYICTTSSSILLFPVDLCPGIGLQVALFFSFFKKPLFSTELVPVYILTNSVGEYTSAF